VDDDGAGLSVSLSRLLYLFNRLCARGFH
jgi:hypothetical protein